MTVPVLYREKRKGERVAICEMPDGACLVLPDWMLERPHCEGMFHGGPRPSVAAMLGFPRKSGQLGLCCFVAKSGSDFVLDRTAVVDRRVQPLGVVEAVEVLADDSLGVVEVGEHAKTSALEL